MSEGMEVSLREHRLKPASPKRKASREARRGSEQNCYTATVIQNNSEKSGTKERKLKPQP
jgi:hypothetical protein